MRWCEMDLDLYFLTDSKIDAIISRYNVRTIVLPRIVLILRPINRKFIIGRKTPQRVDFAAFYRNLIYKSKNPV